MKNFSTQKGSSLLYVILLLGIMLIISFSMAGLSVSELQTTGVNQRSQKAFYLAESGIERSLYELSVTPSATKELTLVTDAATGDSYQYCYGTCGDGVAPSTDKMTYYLKANESRKIYLFNPENLQQAPYVAPGTKINFQCDSCDHVETPAPGLEATIYSFDPAQVSQFDATKLQQSNTGAGSLVDESGISIDTRYYDNIAQYHLSATADDIPVTKTTATGKPYLFMIQLHALQQPETYSVLFTSPVSQENLPTIQAFGQTKSLGVHGDARRGIQLKYNRTEDIADIFNYTLFEDTDLVKKAQ